MGWTIKLATALLLVSIVGCASGPRARDPDSRALAFMESRAAQIEANRESLELVAVRLQSVTDRAASAEACVTAIASELEESREEMRQRIEELRTLKSEMDMAQARLTAMTDAVKELHAWTQGILKNRQDLEKTFGEEYAKMLRIMGALRTKLLSQAHAPEAHKPLFEKLIRSDLLEAIKRQDRPRINARLLEIFGEGYRLDDLQL